MSLNCSFTVILVLSLSGLQKWSHQKTFWSVISCLRKLTSMCLIEQQSLKLSIFLVCSLFQWWERLLSFTAHEFRHPAWFLLNFLHFCVFHRADTPSSYQPCRVNDILSSSDSCLHLCLSDFPDVNRLPSLCRMYVLIVHLLMTPWSDPAPPF